MLKKILYADSGADNAQDMLKRLIELPALKDSELSILRVVSSTTKEEEEESTQQAEAKIKELITKLGIRANKVTSIVREGEPKTTVLKVAEETNADLIIMGSRGLGKLQSILSNSVSQYVFQLTDRPMLLVKDDIYVKRIKRVMVALDKSPAAQYALDLALFLLQGYQDAELFLTRVNPDLKADISFSKQEMEENPILAPAVAKAKRMGINYRCLVTGGKPAQQIRNLAEDNNIDLLILGSPERRPSIAKSLPDLDRLLGSSLSDYIRVKAECPVLLARNEEI
ncbi:UspA domain-containing protein [Stanieria cyanosphaera PCC 7437]|uniref:UspA domain-containing protein n=1 Tax=Stanieria cyanosphaera (strain ATCC 29371 / PCC 7437) TaxID=111780 RepID=K9XTM7_STAC7|nr:universal stress protein [Stanieria cyanosphaera]AFZ35893.1 UspA domain-containing protein [Stanieria cyanosphaera PCC 7437]